GPYLLHFGADGILKSPPIAVANRLEAGTDLRSTQNQLNKNTTAYIKPLVQRSGGFEGMAISPNGRYLYPLLEKPLIDAVTPQLIISEFDLDKTAYTGNFYYFELASQSTAIGDFQLFSAKEGLIIGRDDSAYNLVGYKKLIRITLIRPRESVARETLVNLMDLATPD